MNYLAHILLSGDDRELQLGNFIADAVKGSAYNAYPQGVADGIRMHRAIDRFTDCHPAVRRAVGTLKPHFGRYSAVLLDVYFDYLLASRFADFSAIPLRRFARRFYWTMIRRRQILPPRIKRFMWHFITTDRLTRYASLDGIHRSLEIMVSVHRMGISARDAADYLRDNEPWLREVFTPFFSELQAFCDGYIGADDRPDYIRRMERHAVCPNDGCGSEAHD